MARAAVKWIGVALGAALLAFATWVIVQLRGADPTFLQACMEVEKAPVAWACRQGLYHLHPTPEEVKDLNAEAGARLPLYTPNESDARRLLKHYLDAGVDINAVHQQMESKFTALHGMVLAPELKAVKILLEFGASREIRDAKGRTPLDLAREVQAKHPNPEREEVIRLLEGAPR